MKLLVVGSGGREHALAWKLAQSPRVQVVYVAPGNGGTAQDERLCNVDITDPAALADFAEAYADQNELDYAKLIAAIEVVSPPNKDRVDGKETYGIHEDHARVAERAQLSGIPRD